MNRRIKLITGLHLVALPLILFVVSCQNWPQPVRPLCFGLAFSQSGLLVLWGTLGQGWPRFRSTSAMLGLLCVAVATAFALDRNPQRVVTDASLVMLTAGIVCLDLLGMRVRRGLTLCRHPSPSAILAGSQFSLAHLFMATTFIALLFSFQKAFDGVDFREHTWLRSVLFIAATVPWAVTLQCASLWATLGVRHALTKVLISLPTGLLLGIVPPIQITGSFDGDVYTFWAAALSCQLLISLGTLLVVRSCGWRLCRMAKG